MNAADDRREVFTPPVDGQTSNDGHREAVPGLGGGGMEEEIGRIATAITENLRALATAAYRHGVDVGRTEEALRQQAEANPHLIMVHPPEGAVRGFRYPQGPAGGRRGHRLDLTGDGVRTTGEAT